MAQHKHLFVMDSLENLNLKLDSSLRLAAALSELGHNCYMCAPWDMALSGGEQGQKVSARLRQLTPDKNWLQVASDPIWFDDLSEFSTVHMRKDPPMDMSYVGCTWLLSVLEATTKVYNRGQTLRDKNEKLAIFDYPQYIQPGIVSSDPQLLFEFIENQGTGDVIVKPLDLYGGRGIFRLQVDKQTKPQIMSALTDATSQGKNMRLVQPFNHGIFQGEVRVFTAFGEIISWCLKVPAQGEYLANTRMGAVVLDYQPSPRELAMVQDVSASLRHIGVEFVGYDLIGGYISEINITSPRLLLAPELDEKPYYLKIAQLIVQDLSY